MRLTLAVKGGFSAFRVAKQNPAKSRSIAILVWANSLLDESKRASSRTDPRKHTAARTHVLVRVFHVRELHVSRSPPEFVPRFREYTSRLRGKPTASVASRCLFTVSKNRIMSDDCTSRFATSAAAGFGFGSLIGALNATWQVGQRPTRFTRKTFRRHERNTRVCPRTTMSTDSTPEFAPNPFHPFPKTKNLHRMRPP